MIVHTNISYGYVEFIEMFAKANGLIYVCSPRKDNQQFLDIEFEDDSDTAINISFMSVKHLGFENMLVDYLKRCGIPRETIAYGSKSAQPKKSAEEIEKEWQIYRKEVLGFR